jgi:hypothetical protein
MQSPSLVNFIEGLDAEFIEKETMHRCSCCGEYFPRSMFYVDSRDKTKVRNQCKPCWNYSNGKNPEETGDANVSFDNLDFIEKNGTKQSTKPPKLIDDIFSNIFDEIFDFNKKVKKNDLFLNLLKLEAQELNIDTDRFVQTKYVAHLLGISEKTVARNCKSGKYFCKKIGNRYFINLKFLLENYEKALEKFLEDQKLRKITDIVEKCECWGEIVPNPVKKTFKLSIKNDKRQGVYFFIQFKNKIDDFSEGNVLIQKVGKADGEKGLNGRLRQYSNNTKGIRQLFDVYINTLKNSPLFVYCMPIDTFETTVEGNFTVEVSKAREAEKVYAFYARAQGHPLTLSMFD